MPKGKGKKAQSDNTIINPTLTPAQHNTDVTIRQSIVMIQSEEW